MENNATFQEIASALRGVHRVIVASHLRPDGDALGSTIAMALWLKSLGKDVCAWNEDGMPEKFRYLPESSIVSSPDRSAAPFDALVALDTSVQNRLGSVLDAIAIPPVFINMDHHVSNHRFGSMNYIDPESPATGQIMVEFLTAVGAEITPAIAGNLFAAISTDTGSFQYRNTTARTFEVAAELVRAGVDVGELSQTIYDTQPRRRLELLRHALNTAKFSDDGRVVSFSLSNHDVARLAVIPDDNEGIIDHLRAVDTVQVAVFFEDLGDGKVRVSARSKNPAIDVCKICAVFDGGGHPLAAGARIHGTLEEVEQNFLKEVDNEIRLLD